MVQALGPYAELEPRFADVPTEHFPGRIIAPGFIDLHIHFPQTDVIGSCGGWLAAVAGKLHFSA